MVQTILHGRLRGFNTGAFGSGGKDQAMGSKEIGKIGIEIEEIIAVHHPYQVPEKLTLKYLGRALEAIHLALVDLERRIEALEQEK